MTIAAKPTSRRVYNLLRNVFRFLAWCLLRLEIAGLENVPLEGPVLVVTNHIAFIDPVPIFIHFDRQCMAFVADKWRRTPIIAWLVDTVGVIWVSRGEVDMHAIKSALQVLKEGRLLGIAPEGTRSRSHVLQQGKPGAAFLADRARALILPAVVMGTENFIPNLRRLRRTPVRLVVGQPFRLPSDGRAKPEQLEAYTEIIMCRIAALLEPQYRGFYADHPMLQQFLSDGQPRRQAD